MSRVEATAAILGDRIRRIVIEQSKRANVGHIGSSLSVADILGTLYAGVLQGDGPADPERDRMVLSKGHASLALYAALHETGAIDGDELASFCVDGSRLGTHPDHVLPGVDFSTGSLGHGLSIATGSALAAQPLGQPAAHVRAHERRRVQRGLGLGGGHVRRPPPARRPRARSSTSTASRRSATRATCSTSRRSTSAGAPSAGTSTPSTGTTATRCAPSSTASRPARAGRTCCSRRRSSATASRSWSARSRWHYLPMDDEQYASALAELAVAEARARVAA